LITEEHLNHWLTEIGFQLGGIDSKLKSSDRHENHSLEYINEKASTIRMMIINIKDDMKND